MHADIGAGLTHLELLTMNPPNFTATKILKSIRARRTILWIILSCVSTLKFQHNV